MGATAGVRRVGHRYRETVVRRFDVVSTVVFTFSVYHAVPYHRCAWVANGNSNVKVMTEPLYQVMLTSE